MGALLVVVLSLVVAPCSCWTQDELDLFDLVEEVGIEKSFYHLMNIDKVATWSYGVVLWSPLSVCCPLSWAVGGG